MADTGPPKEPEDSKGENAKGKKKPTKAKPPKWYILTHPESYNPVSLAKERDLSSEIEDFAEENDMQPTDVAVFELGRRMRVDISIKVEPMDKS